MKILPKFLVNSILKRVFHRLFDSLGKKGSEYHEIIDMMVAKKQLGKKEMICHFKSLIQFQTELLYPSRIWSMSKNSKEQIIGITFLSFNITEFFMESCF